MLNVESAHHRLSVTPTTAVYVYHQGSPCPDQGLEWITTRAECEAAAASGQLVGINGVDAGYTGSWAQDVRGCYDATYGPNDKLRFNAALTTTTCPAHQVCVCKQAPTTVAPTTLSP